MNETKFKIFAFIFLIALFFIIFIIHQLTPDKYNNNNENEIKKESMIDTITSTSPVNVQPKDKTYVVSKDVTKDVRKILSLEWDKYSSLGNDKLINAVIDSDILYVYLEKNPVDDLASKLYSLDEEKQSFYQIGKPFLFSVQRIYRKFPYLKNYKMYIVHYEDIIDNYGNKTGSEAKMDAYMSMLPQTAKKVNWDYVKEKFYPSIFYNTDDYERIKNMLDDFYYK